MKESIAYCGLDCEKCEAHIATVNDDNELRIKVAKEWSELNGVEITADMINCLSCRGEGVKSPYCDALCPIRICGMEHKVETCGDCPDMMKCDKVNMVIGNNPQALNNLSEK